MKQFIKVTKKDIEKALIEYIFEQTGMVVCNKATDGLFSDNPLNILDNFVAEIKVKPNGRML